VLRDEGQETPSFATHAQLRYEQGTKKRPFVLGDKYLSPNHSTQVLPLMNNQQKEEEVEPRMTRSNTANLGDSKEVEPQPPF
jgi:hypothetical protein